MELKELIKFEYHIETFRNITNKKLLEELNKLGNAGWELISISENKINNSKEYLFKRQIL